MVTITVTKRAATVTTPRVSTQFYYQMVESRLCITRPIAMATGQRSRMRMHHRQSRVTIKDTSISQILSQAIISLFIIDEIDAEWVQCLIRILDNPESTKNILFINTNFAVHTLYCVKLRIINLMCTVGSVCNSPCIYGWKIVRAISGNSYVKYAGICYWWIKEMVYPQYYWRWMRYQKPNAVTSSHLEPSRITDISLSLLSHFAWMSA